MHKTSGAPKLHYNEVHDQILSRVTLVINTKVLRVEQECSRLQTYEALLIQVCLWIQVTKPAVNLQSTGTHRTLNLHNLQSLAAQRTIEGHERVMNVKTQQPMSAEPESPLLNAI